MSFEGEALSYAALARRSNQLARHLRARGVGPGQLVGIALERSSALMIGLLGILASGAAYVPLDPEYPRERLAFMMADAGMSLLVTQATLADTLPELCATLTRGDVSRLFTVRIIPVLTPHTTESAGSPKPSVLKSTSSHPVLATRPLALHVVNFLALGLSLGCVTQAIAPAGNGAFLLSIPVFVVGTLLILLLAQTLRLMPAGGYVPFARSPGHRVGPAVQSALGGHLQQLSDHGLDLGLAAGALKQRSQLAPDHADHGRHGLHAERLRDAAGRVDVHPGQQVGTGGGVGQRDQIVRQGLRVGAR